MGKWFFASLRMINKRNYQKTVNEVLTTPVAFKPETITACSNFALTEPWFGSIEERKVKFLQFNEALNRIYQKNIRLNFSNNYQKLSSAKSYYTNNSIMMIGRLSVVTYLHEFAHALGKDERGAVRWSVSLFKICCPDQFLRAKHLHHMLVKE